MERKSAIRLITGGKRAKRTKKVRLTLKIYTFILDVLDSNLSKDTSYEGESVNRSQMDIKRKIYDIRN
jgi:hypothetical protein